VRELSHYQSLERDREEAVTAFTPPRQRNQPCQHGEKIMRTPRRLPVAIAASAIVAVVALFASTVVSAQQPSPAPQPAEAASAPPAPSTSAPPAVASAGARMERLSGVWVEGPGYEVTYGRDYAECARRCLDRARCRMVEYYRPEKKCNLYDALRPRKQGGASDVAIKG
jgi:hypothetical protein